MKIPSSLSSAAKRMVVWGVTWGLVISLTEALAFSTMGVWESGNALLWWLLNWLLPLWCLIGCLFVWAAQQGERNLGTRGVLISWLVVSCLTAALQAFIVSGSHTSGYSSLRQTQNPVSWAPTALYDLWLNLFYGGLLVAGYTLSARAERARALLHTTAIARSRTQALLDRARLEMLEGQIDPTLLLESMRELEQRYRDRPRDADQLLETLVEFLRCAMPGLSERNSTVDAELRLASAYARLQLERGERGAWLIEDSLALAPKMQFPSLFMLPLLALGGKDSRPVLRASEANGRITLSISGLRGEASPEFNQRLSTRLRALHGDRFTLDTQLASDTRVTQGQMIGIQMTIGLDPNHTQSTASRRPT